MPHEWKVLVVDDDRLMCWSLTRALNNAGYNVSVSNSGEEASEILQKQDFDLVITDFKMSGINGLDVLKEVKRCCPPAKSILMTAFGSDAVEEQAKQYGAGYVNKPFQVSELVEYVRRLSGS